MARTQQQWDEESVTQIERMSAVTKLRILFVDSDAYTRTKMLKALEPAFEVLCVSSLTEAKQCLATDPPDMLILEVIIGQESGIELCTYIRHTESLHMLPIMFLTSMATIYDKVAGFEAGADDYVIKPFDASHLIARVKLLARIKHLEPHISS